MTKKRYIAWLRGILVFSVLFMIGEAVYHFSGLRMIGTSQLWTTASVTFGQFFMWLWASASLFMAITLWYCHRYLERAQPLLIGIGLFSIFHAIILFHFSRLPLTGIWAATPALFVWMPFYTVQLKIEALLLVAFGLFIGYGVKRSYLSTTI